LKALSQIFAYLPPNMAQRIKALKCPEKITEIRLGLSKPVLICSLSEVSLLKDEVGRCIIADKNIFSYIITKLTGGSLYSVSESIKKGFVTIKGGHRVGICGTAVLEDGIIKTVKNISHLCFRIAREHKGCAQRLSFEISDQGRLISCLISSPPGYGKTTVLRDLCRIIANGELTGDLKRVGIADDRCELADSYEGLGHFDTGIASFVCSGYPKAEAMMLMLRTMSPDVIVTDEIGSEDDFKAVYEAIKCGVSVIASVHALDIYDLKYRFGSDIKAFDKIFFLGNKTDDFKMYRRCKDDY